MIATSCSSRTGGGGSVLHVSTKLTGGTDGGERENGPSESRVLRSPVGLGYWPGRQCPQLQLTPHATKTNQLGTPNLHAQARPQFVSCRLIHLPFSPSQRRRFAPSYLPPVPTPLDPLPDSIHIPRRWSSLELASQASQRPQLRSLLSSSCVLPRSARIETVLGHEAC
jgi:hypothetical protein